MPEPFLITVVVVALAFDFINGFHDTANAIATSVLTRALSIPAAILMAAVLNFAGAMTSEKVASTIGAGMVTPSAITHGVVLSGLLAAIGWNLITWYLGLPSSSSHALIGGLVGAAALSHFEWQTSAGMLTIGFNYGIYEPAGLIKTLLGLIFSPLLGYLAGWGLMVLLTHILRSVAPWVISTWFRRAQIGSTAFMAFSHGSNDAQKSMGVITMALLASGVITEFHVPWWVKIACGIAMALGTAMGGWRIIKTIGRNVSELKPVHGFAAQMSAACVIVGATMLGAPISTTHVVSSSIMGVGSTRRLSSVRWNIAGQIVTAWLLTIPASALLAVVIYWVMGWFGYP
ncbi:MAG: inorganic phosphate transporter [Armatimonadia bacterium]